MLQGLGSVDEPDAVFRLVGAEKDALSDPGDEDANYLLAGERRVGPYLCTLPR